MTPPEVLRIPASGLWQVRVVPNKFAALEPLGGKTQVRGAGPFHSLDGVGYHEVIVETPVHNRCLADMEPKSIELMLRAYQDREAILRVDPQVEFVLIFRNQGERAGTSLAHPHSQIIATPLLPPDLLKKLERARAYRGIHNRCLFCDLRDAELADGRRVVFLGRYFLVVQPFASRVPFETWVLPMRHRATLGDLEEAEFKELTMLLRNTLRALHKAMTLTDWNWVFQAAPVGEDEGQCFLWHVQILPRITTAAGFEMGSGISITTALPEETAEILRQRFQSVSG